MGRGVACVHVAAAALMAVAVPARGGESEDLDRLCTANSAAMESIRTFHCKVKIDDPSARFGLTAGEYWRTGKSERLHFTHSGNENQAVIRDGVVRYLVKQDVGTSPMKGHPEVTESLENGRWFWHGAIERHDGSSPFIFSPWSDALCCMSDGGKRGNVTFTEFVQNHKRDIKAVRRSSEGGTRQETIEFRFPDATCAVHLDPSANYMVKKTERKSDSPTGYSSSAEVSAFKEIAPGVFFPERVVVKRFVNGAAGSDEVFTFYDVVVNQPIADNVFDLKFRHGIRITDRIDGKKYKVNETGVPISEKVPISYASPPPIAPAELPLTETQEEPSRSGWWLLPASIGLLSVAGCVWLLRRRMRVSK